MTHIGMDVHKKHTVFCVLADDGAVLARGKVLSNEEGWTAVLRRWGPQCALVLETGTMAWWLVEVARQFGTEPHVVDARRFKIIAESRKKSDRRDAFELANASRTGIAAQCSVVVPSERARRGRSLLEARVTVVKQCTMARNAALGLLRSVGITFAKRRWTNEATWMAAVLSPNVPGWMRHLLEVHRGMWRSAQDRRAELDSLVASELNAWPDARHLDEIPGFGTVTTLAVAVHLDDASRFGRAKKAGSYGGLAPTVRASGTVTRTSGITKQGSTVLRHVMVQAALASLRSKRLTPNLRRWAGKLIVRRGRAVAAVALARRLLVLACTLMKSGERYSPSGTHLLQQAS